MVRQRPYDMGDKHLILSDIHENGIAVRNFLKKANGRFDDIWLLGDVFGHSEESVGSWQLDGTSFSGVEQLFDFPIFCVWGNWEYWLSHPENDQKNSAQKSHEESLNSRRKLFSSDPYKKIIDSVSEHDILLLPEDSPQFTLFHGCCFSCQQNSEYSPAPWESYLLPHDINTVTREIFGKPETLQTDHFLFGHTHIAGFFVYSKSTMVTMWRVFSKNMLETTIDYSNENQRFGINPGSAGISVNGSPRTAILMDTKERVFQYLTDD